MIHLAHSSKQLTLGPEQLYKFSQIRSCSVGPYASLIRQTLMLLQLYDQRPQKMVTYRSCLNTGGGSSNPITRPLSSVGITETSRGKKFGKTNGNLC